MKLRRVDHILRSRGLNKRVWTACIDFNPFASHANILYLISVCFSIMSNIDQVGNCWFFLFLHLMDVCIMHRKKKTPFFVPSYTPLPSTIYLASHIAFFFFCSCFFFCCHGWPDLITTCWFLWCFSRCMLCISFMWHVMLERTWSAFHVPLNIIRFAFISVFSKHWSMVFVMTANWTYILAYIIYILILLENQTFMFRWIDNVHIKYSI